MSKVRKSRKTSKAKRVAGERLVDRAVQLAVGEGRRGRDRLLEGELVSSEEFPAEVEAVLEDSVGMMREEFYKRVTTKMQDLVDSMLDDLKDRYAEIPPQNIAYSLGVLMKEVNNLNGRPQTLTSSINFGFGPHKRSREEMVRRLSMPLEKEE